MNLSGFLIARIAEDEDAVRGAMHIGCVEDTSDGPDVIHGVLCPNRVLAECDVKRRIVASCAHERTERVTVRKGVYKWQTKLIDPYEGDEGWDVLALLALPYASHPAYDERWRP